MLFTKLTTSASLCCYPLPRLSRSFLVMNCFLSSFVLHTCAVLLILYFFVNVRLYPWQTIVPQLLCMALFGAVPASIRVIDAPPRSASARLPQSQHSSKAATLFSAPVPIRSTSRHSTFASSDASTQPGLGLIGSPPGSYASAAAVAAAVAAAAPPSQSFHSASSRPLPLAVPASGSAAAAAAAAGAAASGALSPPSKAATGQHATNVAQRSIPLRPHRESRCCRCRCAGGTITA